MGDFYYQPSATARGPALRWHPGKTPLGGGGDVREGGDSGGGAVWESPLMAYSCCSGGGSSSSGSQRSASGGGDSARKGTCGKCRKCVYDTVWSSLEEDVCPDSPPPGYSTDSVSSRQKGPVTSSTSTGSADSKRRLWWVSDGQLGPMGSVWTKPPDPEGPAVNDASQSHLSNIAKIFYRFADRTSMQGVPYIRTSRTLGAKLVWSLLFLLCMALLACHLYYLFAVFYSFPKHSTIDLGFSALAFPAVTFCNVNAMKRSGLDAASPSLRYLVSQTDPVHIVELMAEEYNAGGGRKRRRRATPQAGNSRVARAVGVTPGNSASDVAGKRGKKQPADPKTRGKGKGRGKVPRAAGVFPNISTIAPVTSMPLNLMTILKGLMDQDIQDANDNDSYDQPPDQGEGGDSILPGQGQGQDQSQPHQDGKAQDGVPPGQAKKGKNCTGQGQGQRPKGQKNEKFQNCSDSSDQGSVVQNVQGTVDSADPGTEPSGNSGGTVDRPPGPSSSQRPTTTPENRPTPVKGPNVSNTASTKPPNSSTFRKPGGKGDKNGNANPKNPGNNENNQKDTNQNGTEKGDSGSSQDVEVTYKQDGDIDYINDLDLGLEFTNVAKVRQLKEEQEAERRDEAGGGEGAGQPFAEPSVSASITEEFIYLFSNIGEPQRQRAGHQVEDMMVDCSFAGRRCLPQNFSLLTSTVFGNCFTIDHPAMVTTRSGYHGGLSLVVFLESDEYLRGVTTGTGVQVIIHPHLTLPFPEEDGIAVMAGTETNIALRRLNINRLGKPHGSCQEGHVFREKYKHTYTRRACQHFCEHSTVMDRCQCYSEQDGQYARQVLQRNLPPCRSDQDVRCMLDIQYQFEVGAVPCDCDNPCAEQSYYKTVSMRKWPSDEYAGVLVETLCTQRGEIQCEKFRQADQRTIAQNFLKINIFYEDLNYENITEVEDYELVQFASDVGGTVGLWLGLSFLSGFEVLQFLFEVSVYLFTFGPCRKRPKTPDSPRQENTPTRRRRDSQRSDTIPFSEF